MNLLKKIFMRLFALIISWGIVSIFVFLIFWMFGVTISLKFATGVWLIVLFLKIVFNEGD